MEAGDSAVFRGRDHRAWLNEVEPQTLLLPPAADVPNNPALPVLLYKQVAKLPGNEPAALFESLFDHNHWPSAWRNGVFDYPHFHTTAHEALGVYAGQVTVQLGGEQGVEVLIEAGDVAVLPAGVAHRNVGASADLGIVGAYPAGQSPDRGLPEAARVPAWLARIVSVPRPAADPVFGAGGPLERLWR